MLRDSLFWLRAIEVLLRNRWLFAPQPRRDGSKLAAVLVVSRIKGVPSSAGHRVGGRRVPTLVQMRDKRWLVLLVASTKRLLCYDPAIGIVHFSQVVFRRQVDTGAGQFSRTPITRSKEAGQHAHPAGQGAGTTALALAEGAGESGFATQVNGNPLQRRNSSQEQFGNLLRIQIAGVLGGGAARILEAAILAIICLTLFLVQDRVTVQSYLMVVAMCALAAGLLLGVRFVSYACAATAAHQRQSMAWRKVVSQVVKGYDFLGFRGQQEHLLARELRDAISADLPRQGVDATAIGVTVAAMSIISVLHPLLTLMFAFFLSLVCLSMVLDRTYVAEDSLNPVQPQYRRLTQVVGALHPQTLTIVLAEITKWAVIGVSGLTLLTGRLTDVSTVFWVLTAILLIPRDFRLAVTAASGLVWTRDDVFSSTFFQGVPPRSRSTIADLRVEVERDRAVTRVSGIGRLTAALNQSDLTVSEQRRMIADAVIFTLGNLTEVSCPDRRALRIFGLGALVSEAEVEQIALENSLRGLPSGDMLSRAKKALGVATTDGVVESDPQVRTVTGSKRPHQWTSATLDHGQIYLALSVCNTDDFPVFWDMHLTIDPDTFYTLVQDTGIKRATLMTTDCFTLVEPRET